MTLIGTEVTNAIDQINRIYFRDADNNFYCCTIKNFHGIGLVAAKVPTMSYGQFVEQAGTNNILTIPVESVATT